MKKVFIGMILFICVLSTCLASYKLSNKVILQGSIGDSLPIHMTLCISRGKVDGVYYYDKYKKDIKLNGFIYDGKDLHLKEIDENGNVTGNFEGIFISIRRIEGTWSTPNNKTKLPFALNDISNEVLTKNPISAYLKETGFDRFKTSTDNLVRIRKDFNNDGITDVAISFSGTWGESSVGGDWFIYLGKDKENYTLLTTLLFHPQAIRIEPIKTGISKLLVYQRIDRNSGKLIEYQSSDLGIKAINSRILDTRDGEGKDLILFQKLFGELDENEISEFCKISEYLRNENCSWKKGYYDHGQ